MRKLEWLIIKLFLLNNIYKKVPSKKLARLNFFFINIFSSKFRIKSDKANF